MTTDNFTDAARAYAWKRYPTGSDLDRDRRMVVDEFIEWARIHLAAQEPSDAECLAVLNVAIVPLGEPPKRNGLADWNPAAVERVRAALSAARAARRDEEKR